MSRKEKGQLCRSSELRDCVASGGIKYRENQQSYIFDCPMCHKKDKLYIRKTDGRFVCWYCKDLNNFSGYADYALSVLYGMDFDDLAARIYGSVITNPADKSVRVTFLDEEEDEAEILARRSPVSMTWGDHFLSIIHPQAIRGKDYLRSRGIPVDIALQYDLRYIPAERRVYFPVHYNGMQIGWQGRSIVPHKVKILSSGEDCKQGLMFESRLRLQGIDHVILCEGPIDALKAHYCGGNVATMGKTITESQIKLIPPHIKKLYLALDPDAVYEMNKIRHLLNDRFDMFYMPVPAGTDLGAMNFSQVVDLFGIAPKINHDTLLQPFFVS